MAKAPHEVQRLGHAINRIAGISSVTSQYMTDGSVVIFFSAKNLQALVPIAHHIDRRYGGPPVHQGEPWGLLIDCTDVPPFVACRLESIRHRGPLALSWADRIAENMENFFKDPKAMKFWRVKLKRGA